MKDFFCNYIHIFLLLIKMGLGTKSFTSILSLVINLFLVTIGNLSYSLDSTISSNYLLERFLLDTVQYNSKLYFYLLLIKELNNDSMSIASPVMKLFHH